MCLMAYLPPMPPTKFWADGDRPCICSPNYFANYLNITIMFTLTVNHVSDSGKAALVTVTKKIGFATSTVANGWMKVDEGTEKGASMELPADTNVSTREQEVVDKETGNVTVFTWVVLA